MVAIFQIQICELKSQGFLMSSSFSTESEFKFEELFFSRTNTRGIIQSANSVFQESANMNGKNFFKNAA